MFTLIIGASASGKSEFAERHVLGLGENRIYIATMMPWDEECVQRIEKHRNARKGRGFKTVECYTGLEKVSLPRGANVLLECMSNLCANEIYTENGCGAEKAEAHILNGIDQLLQSCEHLTVVTNEVFSGGSSYDEETIRYLKKLALINRRMAERADNVYEIVCGLPNVLKGELI